MSALPSPVSRPSGPVAPAPPILQAAVAQPVLQASLSTPAHAAAPWHERLSLLLESTGDGIFGIDLDGRCTFINRAGAAMLGHDVESVLGRNMHYLVHHTHACGGHYAVEECPIFHAFRRGEPCRIEDEVLWRADGSCFDAEYASYPIHDGGQVVGAVVTFKDISARRQAERLLRKAKDELELRVAERTQALSEALTQVRELAAHSHQVREAERTRIAREVHDELGSLLVALKLDVTWMAKRLDDRAELAAKCASMNRLIESAVENVGRIITDLRPSILDHQGLLAALEWQVDEFREATELSIDCAIEIDSDAHDPQGALATAVFRIFQEMLSNVARHARAHQVVIRVALERERLSIRVADDGCGAAAPAFERPDSFGVLGMRERAQHFGGRLAIDSRPGRGTSVVLDVPLCDGGPCAPETLGDPLGAVAAGGAAATVEVEHVTGASFALRDAPRLVLDDHGRLSDCAGLGRFDLVDGRAR